MAVRVGFTLQPERRFLELLEDVAREADYWEVAPETLWRPGPGGPGAPFVPNGFHRLFRAWGEQHGTPFVAHGVGFSVGSARPDRARRARWLDAIRADQAVFDFAWYTDHLGVTHLDREELLLPLPVPQTDAAADVVRAALREMQEVVPDVGVENSVFYHHLGDPLDEPAWLARALDGEGLHLLLDLHNVWTTAVNSGFDPHAYLDRLPLERVIEVHVSGGTDSDPGWLPEGRTLRLDSHDHAVPEEVWALLDATLPRLPNLRGVTLERMEGTVDEADVPGLRDELQRLRGVLEGAGRATGSGDGPLAPPAGSNENGGDAPAESPTGPAPADDARARDDLARLEAGVARALRAPDPVAAFARLADSEELPEALRTGLRHAAPDGVRISALLVVRLRFERLMQGSRLAGEWFERDPAEFAAAVRRYHREVPPGDPMPTEEAARFAAWCEREGRPGGTGPR